jgi:dTDP-4-amino-4,6-dideoxygalactose transaminase
MSNIFACIGRDQIDVLYERVAKRRADNQHYCEFFAAVDSITFQTEPNSDFLTDYWLTEILIDPEKTGGISRENVRFALDAENIEYHPLCKPLHLKLV